MCAAVGGERHVPVGVGAAVGVLEEVAQESCESEGQHHTASLVQSAGEKARVLLADNELHV